MQKHILLLLGLTATSVYGLHLKGKAEAEQQTCSFGTSPNVLLNAGGASQSSSPYGDTGKASNAVDGGKSCSWTGLAATNSLTHTNSETNPWWKADLGQPKNIKYLNVYNRLDCCGERLANYQIRIGNNADMFENPTCPGTYTGS
jgi:hypothetical protein